MNEVFYRDLGKVYYLSYMKLPSDLCRAFDDALGVKEENRGRDETAICFNDPWKCLILYGDHREAMKPIEGDIEALKNYWESKPELVGDTSDTLVS